MSQSLSTYFYRAMTPEGRTTIGFRAASDEGDLSTKLRQKDLLLLTATLIPMPAGLASSGESKKRNSLKDELALNQQLATLLGRGVPLVEALEVAEDVVSSKMKAKVTKLRELVSAGASFSNACEQLGGFDGMTIAVYRAAERTGDLDAAADRLAIAAKRQMAVRGKAVTAMIYPAIIAVIAVVVVAVLLLFLVPVFKGQLETMSDTVELNMLSRAVFGLSDWFRANWLWVLAGVGVVGATITAFSAVVGQIVMAILHRLAVVRKLLTASELSRFFSVMAAMTRSGVPLSEALAASVGVIGDRELRTQLEKLQQDLVDGSLLRTLIEQVEALPLAVRRLLIAAERAGDLDEAFESLAQDMSAELDERSARLLAVLEPATIIILAMIIAPIIIAVALPILTSAGSVSG